MTVGIFDSGIGGLTVMRALIRRLPHLSVVYFADTARMPYGEKKPEVIERYSRASADFLVDQQVSLLALACHTASAYASQKVFGEFPIPVVDVISAAAQAACSLSISGRMALLATRATVLSGSYERAISVFRSNATLFSFACPLLAPLVEEQMVDHLATELIIADYLRPLKDCGVDVVILGCTHYPLLREIIQRQVGPDILLIDPADYCIDRIEPLFKSTVTTSNPSYSFFVSDDPERFSNAAKIVFPEISIRPSLHLL